uniref:Uncharacterized protein n=1 Tax=Oryza nivara TaxID=4536 RepID=A0A0E0FJ36_ORYNI
MASGDHLWHRDLHAAVAAARSGSGEEEEAVRRAALPNAASFTAAGGVGWPRGRRSSSAMPRPPSPRDSRRACHAGGRKARTSTASPSCMAWRDANSDHCPVRR